MSDEALTYLQGDSRGPKRDLIARCYYEVAQGDPKSGPVVFAVLSNAAAEQFAKTPEELREANECLRLLLGEARDFEKKLRDRVETSNATVILSFKDETRRAREAWQETINQAEYVRERARLLADDMGLGKTLQALAFCAWLKAGEDSHRELQRRLKRAEEVRQTEEGQVLI